MVKDYTGERLASIETSLEYLKQEQAEQKILMQEFIRSADTKYATKLTEKMVYGMAALMLTTIIIAIIRQVIVGS